MANNSTAGVTSSYSQESKSITWLPAIVVKGEGVFFEFNRNRLNEWAENQEVRNRADLLSINYNQPRLAKGQSR